MRKSKRYASGRLGACMAAVMAGCGSEPEQDYVSQGMELIEQMDYEGADLF